jgi:heme exporter protein D
MYFDSFWAALAMDGHGVYVWSAYFITLVAISSILILPKIRERKILAQLAGDLRRQDTHSHLSTGIT